MGNVLAVNGGTDPVQTGTELVVAEGTADVALVVAKVVGFAAQMD